MYTYFEFPRSAYLSLQMMGIMSIAGLYLLVCPKLNVGVIPLSNAA